MTLGGDGGEWEWNKRQGNDLKLFHHPAALDRGSSPPPCYQLASDTKINSIKHFLSESKCSLSMIKEALLATAIVTIEVKANHNWKQKKIFTKSSVILNS